MQNTFRKIFAPPVFPEDEDKTRSAAIINTIGWITLFITVAALTLRIVQGQDVNLVEVNLVLTAIIIVIVLLIFLTHRGSVRIASILLSSTVWLGLGYLTWLADGIRDVAFLGLCVAILMAGLLLGWLGAIIATVATILLGWALAYAEIYHFFIPTLDTPLHFARDTTLIFGLIGALIYLMIDSLQKALKKSRAAAQELSSSNKELNELRVDLEQRVEERTSELRKRAAQLEAVSSVARTIVSMQDIDTLLPAITKLISQRFMFYHVGIFLLDQKQENAVLRASNSEGGLRMLNRQHSLPLDHHSIVGYSVSRGESRIALDVGAD